MFGKVWINTRILLTLYKLFAIQSKKYRTAKKYSTAIYVTIRPEINTKNISFPPSICIIVTCMLHACDSISLSDCRHVIKLNIIIIIIIIHSLQHEERSYKEEKQVGENTPVEDWFLGGRKIFM